MGERVITDAFLLRIIIIVLNEERQEMTPDEIYKSVHRRQLLPNVRGLTECIFKVLRESPEKQQGFFYLSSKRWRASPEKTVLIEVISLLDSFRTHEFRALVRQKLGLEHESKSSHILTELIEDGIIERTSFGEYFVLKNTEKP